MGLSNDGLAITPYLNSWAYEQEKHKKANGYIAFYRNKQIEVRADTSLEAQRLAAHYWRVKRPFDVTVVLAEIGSEPVIHTPDF